MGLSIDEPPPGTGAHSAATQPLARFVARLGLAMIAAGESVAATHDALRTISGAYGVHDASFYTLPTGSVVVLRDADETRIELATEGARTLRLDQVHGVYDVIGDATRAELTPEQGLQRLDAVLSAPPSYSWAASLTGHALASLGFALILQLSWPVTAVAVLAGLIAGALRLVGARERHVEMVRPVLAAFACGAIVFLLARLDWVADPYQALIPPLVMSLPFVAMTLATLELADRQIISGATRLVFAVVQVLLLAFGLLAAEQLVDPSLADATVTPAHAIGAWGPWVGTVVFAVGVSLHLSAPLRALPWLIAVCLAARVGLEVGDLIGSTYLGAMIGALFMSLVADWAAHRRHGPPRLVTFSPTFILLIPGVPALTGLVELFGPERAAGFGDLASAMFVLVAISVGLIMGVGLYSAMRCRRTAAAAGG